MKRDPRLRSLSSDHHRALVMARKMKKAGNSGDVDPELLNEIQVFCSDEIQTIISPVNTIPDIAKRTRLRKKQK